MAKIVNISRSEDEERQRTKAKARFRAGDAELSRGFEEAM